MLSKETHQRNNRGLVGFVALVLVGQQFYRLVPTMDYTVACECQVVYVVLSMTQFQRT